MIDQTNKETIFAFLTVVLIVILMTIGFSVYNIYIGSDSSHYKNDLYYCIGERAAEMADIEEIKMLKSGLMNYTTTIGDLAKLMDFENDDSDEDFLLENPLFEIESNLNKTGRCSTFCGSFKMYSRYDTSLGISLIESYQKARNGQKYVYPTTTYICDKSMNNTQCTNHFMQTYYLATMDILKSCVITQPWNYVRCGMQHGILTRLKEIWDFNVKYNSTNLELIQLDIDRILEECN